MRLWLDDTRNPVEHTGECDWTWVKTAEEAIAIISERWQEIEAMSLDHDLDCGHYAMCEEEDVYVPSSYPPPKTGYQVVCFMVETGKWPRNKPRVHSYNPAGRLAMEQMIERWFGREAQGT